jgi:hypothetical protein
VVELSAGDSCDVGLIGLELGNKSDLDTGQLRNRMHSLGPRLLWVKRE